MHSTDNFSKSNEKIKKMEESIKELTDIFNDEKNTLCEEIEKLELRKAAIQDIKKDIQYSLVPDPITLNIGGKKFETTKLTLSKFPGTYFDAMVSGEIDIKTVVGDSNTYFIDRDSFNFRYILNYLRTGDLVYPEKCRDEFKRELEFYRLPLPKLLTDAQFGIINGWLGGAKSFVSIYKGSINGFGIVDFHKHCDNKGATLIVVKSTDGNVFGGYNSQSWTNNASYYGDNQCFIYTMVNKNGISPTKYISGNSNFVYSTNTIGFGGGHDLCVSDKCDSNETSYQNFPYSYKDTTGFGQKTFASTKNFRVSEIEVYQVL